MAWHTATSLFTVISMIMVWWTQDPTIQPPDRKLLIDCQNHQMVAKGSVAKGSAIDDAFSMTMQARRLVSASLRTVGLLVVEVVLLRQGKALTAPPLHPRRREMSRPSQKSSKQVIPASVKDLKDTTHSAVVNF